MFNFKGYLGNFFSTDGSGSTLGHSHKFPQHGISAAIIKNHLKDIRDQLSRRNPEQFFGWLYSLPHELSVFAYSLFLPQNPSNLGTWLNTKTETLSTQRLEKEILLKMSDLFNVSSNKVEGYVTTGGTESNIFSAWVGRTLFEKKFSKDCICLLRTELSHYSINKASRIVGIKDFIVPLDNNWGMSSSGLYKIVKKLYAKKYRAFVMPLTLGYTLTGTSDNYIELNKKILEIKKNLKNISFFVWIDASLNGLTIPFIQKNFSPLSYSEIQAINVDFHKLGLVPYSSGIILYRKKLAKLIKRPIDYLPVFDTTLLGSRSGASVAATWAIINYFGKEGYKKIVSECLENKEYFVKRLNEEAPSALILTHPESVSCGIIFDKEIRNKETIDKFGMYKSKVKLSFYKQKKREFIIYKFYFLPSITKQVIDSFFNSLANSN